MNSLKNMTIGRRIFLGLSLLLLIPIFQGVFSLVALNSTNHKVGEIENKWLPSAILIGKINTHIADLASDELRYAQATDPGQQQDLESNMQDAVASINNDQSAYKQLVSSSKEQQLYQAFAAQWTEYASVHQQILPLVKAHKTQEVSKMLARVDVLFDESSQTLTKLVDYNQQSTAAAAAQSDNNFANIKKVVYIGLLVALLVGIASGWFMKLGASQISSTIKNSVEQLIKLSLALSASTQQASAGAQQNAAIAQQVAAGAVQQSKQAEEISKALTQMSQAAGQMATTSQDVSANTTQASKLAQQTGESTEKISKMVEVVTTTAEQTNLLALNAAIEAARAGEAGRGFAVVADEVRKLADSSSKAAGEVQQIVKEIAGNISITVESIGKSSLRIGDVASAINQQSTVISQVARTMDSIASVAEQSASGAQQLSASTQQTSAATQQVAAASTDLQRLADQLKKVVSGKSREPLSSTPIEVPSSVKPAHHLTAYHATAAPETMPSHITKPTLDIIATPRQIEQHALAAEHAASNEPNDLRQTDEPKQ